MRVENPCGLPEDRLAVITNDAAQSTTVGQLLEWGRKHPALFASAGVLSDVVVQDEFTHDVVAALTNGLVLVYDST
jgi:hypothetical protein